MPSPVNARAPGAYIEQALRSRPAELRTGVPAFVGLVAASGPAGASAEAELFAPSPVARLDHRTFSSLETRAGASWGGGRLGVAVRGFFENGGSLCYIVDPRLGGVDAGLEALFALDEFDLVCAPDLAGASSAPLVAAQLKIVDFCREHGGAFAILDSVGAPSPSLAINAAALKAHRDALSDALSTIEGGKHAALYGPWIKVRGACAACGGVGALAGSPGIACVTCSGSGSGFVPPCGHIAGVYSRTDGRSGVSKAPANEVIEGAFDLLLAIDEATQTYLNPAGRGWVNCVRAFPGRGIRVWGARTLTTDAGADQVSVRRLLTTIGRWLEREAQSFAFEPNTFALWVRINRQVTAYLQGMLASGALKGRSPKEAFFVKCDAETNPPEVQAAGKVVTEVGVAPVRPNEFIVVRLVTGASGAATAVTT